MGGERVEMLSDELQRWVEEKAEELGVERADVMRRALTAYRLVDEADGHIDEVDGHIDDAFEARADELERRVDALETDLDEKVTDVRERVIQVKREADAKAPADHAHAELAADASDALDAVGDVRASLDSLDERVDDGFENYEEVLEYLTDAADETETRLDTVANAIYDLRRRAAETDRVLAARTAATELKREANREGIPAANCQSCDERVDIALLDVPSCPHCGETFDGVRAGRYLWNAATLTTGHRPALEDPAEAAAAAEPVFDADRGTDGETDAGVEK